jgi:tetratricopeptide (TPR) repeat protein
MSIVNAASRTAADGGVVYDVIVLLHGIRTRALWYDTAKRLLTDIGTVEVRTIGYGRFDALRFLLPFTRRSVRRLVLKELRAIKWMFDKEQRALQMSVIAHSFGTYTIVKLLEEEDDIDLFNLVLCGSVLPSYYDFGPIRRKVSNIIVNDAGSRDVWPILARLATIGYGDSGTFGFLKGSVVDRFHAFRHSDFFTADFISRYWVSLFLQRKIENSDIDRSMQHSSFPIRLLSSLPEAVFPKLILPLLMVTSLASPTITLLTPLATRLLHPESIIQADRERVCEIAVGKADAAAIVEALLNFSGNASFKAESFCELAKNGNIDDAHVLSLYARSLVASGNVETALSVFSTAADKGDMFSLEVLANYYSHYVEPNEEKSIKYYETLIMMGDSNAALALGLLFETGIFSKFDYSTAAKYYALGVERKNADCMYRLAQLLQFGLGVDKNITRARELYRQATFAGNRDSVDALNQLNRRE